MAREVVLLIVGLVILALLYIRKKDIAYVVSDVDGRKYLIRNNYSDTQKQESANVLAEINRRVDKLLLVLRTKYATDQSVSHFLVKLQQNYKPSVLSEAAIDSRYTTFTLDKSDIHVCLRTRDDQQQIYDIDKLMYVIIHELAHMANYDVSGNPIMGHGQEFRDIFKLLLKESIAVGIYKYANYAAQPVEYCGMMINSNILTPSDVARIR